MLFVLLSACSTIKVPQATTGSKSDGIVSMAYEVGGFEKPIVDWDAVRESAAARCRAWGYTNAEPFGGSKMNCNVYNGYGNCVRAVYTNDYQCTGGTKN